MNKKIRKITTFLLVLIMTINITPISSFSEDRYPAGITLNEDAELRGNSSPSVVTVKVTDQTSDTSLYDGKHYVFARVDNVYGGTAVLETGKSDYSLTLVNLDNTSEIYSGTNTPTVGIIKKDGGTPNRWEVFDSGNARNRVEENGVFEGKRFTFNGNTITVSEAPKHQYKVVLLDQAGETTTGHPTGTYYLYAKIHDKDLYAVCPVDFTQTGNVTLTFASMNGGEPAEQPYDAAYPLESIALVTNNQNGQKPTPNEAQWGNAGVVRYEPNGVLEDQYRFVSAAQDQTNSNVTVITMQEIPTIPVTIDFYEKDAKLTGDIVTGEKTAFAAKAANEKYYIRIYCYKKDAGENDGPIGYSLIELDPAGKETLSVNISTFKSCTDNSTFSFDPEEHKTQKKGFRFVCDTNNALGLNGNPSYETVSDPRVDESLPEDWKVFANIPHSPQDPGATISVKKDKDREYRIRFQMENPGNHAPISIEEDDEIFVLVTAEHQSTGTGYFLKKLSIPDNDPVDIVVDHWYNENGSIREGETYTGSEQNVTVQIIRTKLGKSITTISEALEQNNREVIAQGSEVKIYELKSIDNPKPTEPDSVLSTDTKDVFVCTVTLKAPSGTISRNEVISSVRNATHFGFYTLDWAGQSGDMESNGAAWRVTMVSKSADMWGFSGNNLRANKIEVEKTFVDQYGKPVAGREVHLRLKMISKVNYSDGGIGGDSTDVWDQTVTTDENGHVDVTFSGLYAGTYRLYEVINGTEYCYSSDVRVDGDGANKTTFEFYDENGAVIDPSTAEGTKDISLSNTNYYIYFGSLAGVDDSVIRELIRTARSGSGKKIVVDADSFQHVCEINATLGSGDQGEILVQGQNGAPSYDMPSDFETMANMSETLANTTSSDTVRIINKTAGEAVHLGRDDGRLVVVNILCSGDEISPSVRTFYVNDEGEEKQINAVFNHDGRNWSSRIVYNFVQVKEGTTDEYEPYQGKISPADGTSGILLAPKATVGSLGENWGGTIIANRLEHGGSEIHSEQWDDDIDTGSAGVLNRINQTSVSVEKKWNDANGPMAWPAGATVTVKLYKNGAEFTSVDLTADKTSHTFAGLEALDSENNVIAYTVGETITGGETSGFSGIITPTEDGYSITNTNAKFGTAQIQAEKALGAGDSWPDGAKAKFTLTAVTEGAPMPDEEDRIRTLTGPGPVTFGIIDLTEAHLEESGAPKTYEYTITETMTGFPTGWYTEPNPAKITAQMTVSVDGDHLKGEVAYTPVDKTITNKLSTGTITVNKEVLLNGTLDPSAAGKTFSVGLFTRLGDTYTQVPGTQTQEVSIGNDGKGSAEFSEIKYGTYYVFEMKDGTRVGSHMGIYTVTGSGTAVELTAPTATHTITNNHETINIEGTKTWNDALTDHSSLNAALLKLFRKLKSEPDSAYTDITADAASALTWTQDATNPKLYTYAFSGLEKYDENGNEYAYKVEESVPAGYVMTSTAGKEYGRHFVNKWAQGTYQIKGEKGINTGELTAAEAGKYKFTLTALSPTNAPLPADPGCEKPLTLDTTDNKYKFAFDSITYKLTDLDTDANGEPVPTTFVYEITENETNEGIENDQYIHTVEVKVSYDEAHPTVLKVEPTYKSAGYVISDGFSKFTNTRLTGELELTKTVTGTDDTEKAFVFNISGAPLAGKTYQYILTDKDGNPGTETDITFDATGSQDVTLKAGEKILIKNLPDKTSYTITEKTVPDGYSIVNPESGNSMIGEIVAGKTKYADFVNTYRAEEKVSFKARKELTHGTLTGKTFTVRLSQVTGNNSTTAVTGSASKIPTPLVRTFSATDGTAEFTDVVTFVKNKDQDDSAAGKNVYWFLLEEIIPDEAVNNILDGVKYVQNRTWISVTVTDNKNGTLKVEKSPNKEIDVTFTNEQLGSVKVTKAVTGDLTLADLPEAFKITATYQDASNTTHNAEFTADNADVSDGKYEWVIRDIPIGQNVSFTETGILVNGYSLAVNSGAVPVTVEGTNASAALTAAVQETIGDASTAAFVNNYTREKGRLRVTKHVTVNGTASDSPLMNGIYTFNITGTDDDPRTKGENHVVTITITDGQVAAGTIDGTAKTLVVDGSGKWVELTDLPTGTYEVEEDTTGLAEKGITLSSENPQTVTVVKYDASDASTVKTAPFTNNRGAGSMTISKEVTLSSNVTDQATHYSKEFTFDISLTEQDGITPISGTFVTKVVTYDIQNNQTTSLPDGQITFTAGKAQIKLKHKCSVTITGIPLKTKYTVTEVNDSTYAKTKPAGAASGTISATPVQEAFVNSYNLQGTSITLGGTKFIDGTDSTNQQFTFELYQTDNSEYNISGKPPIATFTEGEITRDTGKPFSFAPIEYKTDTDAGKTYYYVIKEQALTGEAQGAWTLTGVNEYHVEVLVTIEHISEGNDKLKAEIKSNTAADQMNFRNTYRAKGSAALTVQKTFAGTAWPQGKTFSFVLKQVRANNSEAAPDANKVVLSGEKTITVGNNTPQSFEAVDFFKGIDEGGNYVNQEGTYWFLIKEVLPEGVNEASQVKDGIRYDTHKQWIKVTVTDDKNGHLNVSKEYSPVLAASTDPDASFTNTQLGSVRVSKAFINHDMPSGFQIEATYNDGIKNVTKILKTTAGGGAVTPMAGGEGTAEKPFVWEIKDLPIGTFVTFRETGIKVNGYTLEVSGAQLAADGESATTTAEYKAAAEAPVAVLVNTYTRDLGSLQLKKTVGIDQKNPATNITNTDLVDGEYTFHITGSGLAKGEARTVTVKITDGAIDTVTGGGAVKAGTGATAYALISDLPTGTYTVTEDTSGLSANAIRLTEEPSSSYDIQKDGESVTINTAVFTNKRLVSELEIRKKVTASGPLTPDPNTQFTFNVSLADEHGKPISGIFAATGADGTAATIAFTNGLSADIKLKADQSFVISDIPQNANYQITEKDIPSGFTPVSGTMTGQITASRSVVQYENKYSLTGTSVVFSGKKILQGVDSSEKEFEYELYEATGADYTIDTTKDPMTAKSQGSPNGTSYNFPQIEYEAPGTHYYVIKEKRAGETDNGWLYSNAEYREKVVVADNGSGGLEAIVSGTAAKDAINFTNLYSEAYYTPKIIKKVKGPEAPGGTYEFKLVKTDSANSKTRNKDSDVLGTDAVSITIDPLTEKDREKAVQQDFGQITYIEKGVYTYVISEITQSGIEGMTYTADKIELSVTVSRDTDGTLKAVGEYKDYNKTLINTYKVYTSATVRKEWYEEGIEDILPPDKLDVDLMQGSTKIQSVTLNIQNNWTATVDDLLKYDENGKEIQYTWKEAKVKGYELAESKTEGQITTLKNNRRSDTQTIHDSIRINKQDENGAPLDGAEFTLFEEADCSEQSKLVTYSGKSFSIGTKEMYEDATLTMILPFKPEKPVTLYLKETKAPAHYERDDTVHQIVISIEIKDEGYNEERDMFVFTLTYKMTIDGAASLTVKNKPEVPRTNVFVKKAWNDDGNRDGLRPLQIKLSLLADGKTTGETVTLSEENNWLASVCDLPTEEDGKEIVYSWYEPHVSGYTLTDTRKDGALTVLTNTHKPEEIDISVRKVWVDEGTHPESVTVQLFADGLGVGGEITLNAGNDWKYTWKGLCKYTNPTEDTAGAHEIEYSVAETEIPAGYQARITGNAETGFVIRNTLLAGKLVIEKDIDIEGIDEPGEDESTTDIEVVKIWEDNDNKDGNRPKSVTIHLFAGGQEIKTATLSEANGWKRHFGKLPKFVNGHPIHYSVTEDPVEWYVTDIHGFTIRNRYMPETTSVVVRKVWNDDGNKANRPPSVVMKLNNGMMVELNEQNGWMASISDLPARINGKPAVYTWTEQSVMGYVMESSVTEGNVTTITNKPYQPETEIGKTGRKTGEPDEFVPISDYNTALGLDTIINHVGDCFD